jgi:hypothetical protein
MRSRIREPCKDVRYDDNMSIVAFLEKLLWKQWRQKTNEICRENSKEVIIVFQARIMTFFFLVYTRS